MTDPADGRGIVPPYMTDAIRLARQTRDWMKAIDIDDVAYGYGPLWDVYPYAKELDQLANRSNQ